MQQPRDKNGRFLSWSDRYPKRMSKKEVTARQNAAIRGPTAPIATYQPPEERKTTLVLYLIDRSGSMSSWRTRVVDGFNEYIGGLRHDAGDKVLFSVHMFDSSGVIRRNTVMPIEQVKGMALHEFVAGGSTPLYDAIHNIITEHDELIRQQGIQASKILTVIHTDGKENCSTRSLSEINRLISDKQDSGFWTFVYMGSDLNAKREAASLGIPVGNTYQFAPGAHGQTMSAAAIDTQGYRSSPLAATNVFFQAGIKLVNGVEVKARKRHQHTGSDGYTKYTTTEWLDGTWSCNCPGWAFNKQCKHIGGGISAVVK